MFLAVNLVSPISKDLTSELHDLYQVSADLPGGRLRTYATMLLCLHRQSPPSHYAPYTPYSPNIQPSHPTHTSAPLIRTPPQYPLPDPSPPTSSLPSKSSLPSSAAAAPAAHSYSATTSFRQLLLVLRPNQLWRRRRRRGREPLLTMTQIVLRRGCSA